MFYNFCCFSLQFKALEDEDKERDETQLKHTIIRYLNKSFILGVQQDAHEVLQYLLDALSSLESKRVSNRNVYSFPPEEELKTKTIRKCIYPLNAFTSSSNNLDRKSTV